VTGIHSLQRRISSVSSNPKMPFEGLAVLSYATTIPALFVGVVEGREDA